MRGSVLSFTMNPRTNCRAWPRHCPANWPIPSGLRDGRQQQYCVKSSRHGRGRIRAGSIRDENDLSCGRHHGGAAFPAGVAGAAQGERLEAEGAGPPLECVRNLGSVSWPITPIGARTGTMPAGVCPIFVPGGPANRARQAQTHQSREALNEQTSSPHHHLYPAQGGQRGGYRFSGRRFLDDAFDGWYS